MNKKTITLLTSVLGIVVCCTGIAIWGIYSLVSNPTVKEGLKQAGDEFNAMADLRKKVHDTYASEDVGVQLMNGTVLNVSLINSEFDQLSTAQQNDRAREIAQFVKANYTGKARITGIVISFVAKTQAGPLNTHSSSSYPFDLSDLK